MITDLEALRDILSSSISGIVDVCKKTGKDFPSLNDPVHPSEFTSDSVRNRPEIAENITLAIAAASQLIAALQHPVTTLMISAYAYTLPACLGVAEGANVAEIIRSAGPKGMHVSEISQKSGVDVKKLEHILRVLATNHWFREVSEDTFANNLLSSLLDTGKNVTDNFAPIKHQGTSGFAAAIGYASDEGIKSAAYLKEVILDPKTTSSEEVYHSGFQKAFKTDLSFWQYLDRPENKYNSDRFNLVMSSRVSPEAIQTGYNWEDVQDGILVDVAGGTGHVSMQVAKQYPNIRVVVEDRKAVIEQAEKYWNKHLPSHGLKGNVHFIETNILEDQPSLPGPPDIFLLRWILHDWSDKNAIRILKKLRKAAVLGKTKLLIADTVIDYACEYHGPPVKLVGSGASKPAPQPLLANYGGGNLLPYKVEIAVLSLVNSLERTIQGFIDVLEPSGWRLSHVQRTAGSESFSPIVAIPNPEYDASND